jgi:hypothetical protein
MHIWYLELFWKSLVGLDGSGDEKFKGEMRPRNTRIDAKKEGFLTTDGHG